MRRETETKCVLSVQPVAESAGSDRALLSMVRSLSADGWTCHVVTPASSPIEDQFVAAGATMHVVPMRRLTTSGNRLRWLVTYLACWPVSTIRLILLARHAKARVIHSNSLNCLYGWMVALVLRKPHIWHAREIIHQDPFAAWLLPRLARHQATMVIAISQAVAAQLHPANVTVILDEADPEEFRPGRAGVFRQQVHIGDRTPLVGTVCRIDTWKGVEVVLEAVPAIREERPDVEILIAGPPVEGKRDHYEKMKAWADDLAGVHWLGYCKNVADLIADLDVLVLASTKPEPFGLVLVEALACGVPVVATDHGGPPEILAGSEPGAGRLVPPQDHDALARAALELLPEGSDATARQLRKPLRHNRPPSFGPHFAAVAVSGRRRPKKDSC